MLSGPAVRLEFSRPAEAPQTWRESVVPQTTKEVGSPVILGLNMVDLVLIVALLALATVGWRRGFLISAGGILGLLAGVVATFFAAPLVSQWIPDPAWRPAGILAAFVVLVSVGHAAGEGFTVLLRGWMDMPRPRWWSRLGGAAVNVVATMFAVSALAFTFSSLGIPFLSTQIAESKVVSASRNLTPEPVERALGEARSLVAGLPLPELLVPVLPTENVPVPETSETSPSTDVMKTVRASVAKVTGNAPACGVNQTGSSFVVAPDRVLTNAHVVSGVSEPVVETEDGRALTGRVVAFDSARDVAVIAVEGLNLKPLSMGKELSQGAKGVFMGYPAGGPFTAQPAAVQARQGMKVPNIYGQAPAVLDVYQLAADVKQGNSGGPFLQEDGKYAGMIFAKAKDQQKIGYALGLAELRSYVKAAPSLSKAVSTGTCLSH